MNDFKKLTDQLLRIYSVSKSVDDLNIDNFFDENISIIGTGEHEVFENLHEFLDSFKFDVGRRGKIKIDIRNLCQKEEQLDDNHVLAHGSVDFVGLFEDARSTGQKEVNIMGKYEQDARLLLEYVGGKENMYEQVSSS